MLTANVDAGLVFVPSDAEQLTVLDPKAKTSPDCGLQLTETPDGSLTVSVAVAAKLILAPFGGGRLASTVTLPLASSAKVPACGSGSAGSRGSTVIDDGIFSTGGVVSETATTKDREDSLSDASVAVHVTVVDPRTKADPDSGRQLTVGDVSTVSLATGVE